MKTALLLLVSMLAVLMPGSALAKPAAPAKPAMPAAAAQCAACHGASGNSADGVAPNLAAQLPEYITLQLANFRSGERPHAVMKAIASGLSVEQGAALARYFGAASAALPKSPPGAGQPPSSALLAQGRKVFEQGGGAGAPACASCHGAQGQGQIQRSAGAAPALYPRIASQPAAYTHAQLALYRDVPAFNNPLAMVMKSVAVRLSEGEMHAVSAYLASVR